MIALSPNSEEVWIYKASGEDVKKWEKKYTLREHGGPVSGIDWCASTNLIATCGHDRNAYVWKHDPKSDTWKPTLVILRINRAATFVKWSPAGNKFAVASGAKCVPICQFEESSDWWISKMIKKHKSTVLSLAWCCNNKFIITGGCDHKARIFSAYIPGLDPAEDDGFGEVWPQQHEFGTCLAEFNVAKSWVQSVAWSPNGFRLCFTGHNSTIHFVQILAGSKPVVNSVSLKSLPFLAVRFLTDNTIVAVGFDNTPTSLPLTARPIPNGRSKKPSTRKTKKQLRRRLHLLRRLVAPAGPPRQRSRTQRPCGKTLPRRVLPLVDQHRRARTQVRQLYRL